MYISDIFDVKKNSPLYGLPFILGKILKGSGFKLTNEYILREKKLGIETHQSKVGHVVITQDLSVLFEILEMDVEKFNEGFSSQEEMFEFVRTTPYLKSSKFTELNKKSSRKQVFYDFQEHLISNNIETPGKNITLEHIDSCVMFDFIAEIENLDAKEERKRGAIEKFNGRTILNHFPDFNKKLIRESIRNFKFSFGNVESFRDFLLGNTEEEIIKKFKEVVQF